MKLQADYSLCLVFRKPNPLFFSIEKVFRQLIHQWSPQLELRSVYARHYSSSLLDIAKNVMSLRKEKADVYHITGDIHYAVFAFPRKRTILTIHDCVFLYKYKGFKQKLITSLFLKWPVKHCKYVTTISEKSREEIVRFTGCKPQKVIVIQNPVSEAIYYEQKAFNEAKPVLLFIGSTPNKNLERVCEAISALNCTLRIIGVLEEEMKRKLVAKNIDFSTRHGLTEDELAQQYAEADIILFPSLYEGFGLPIIEGQKSGRPVITSALNPMQEVAGNGACLVNPHDIESIRQGIMKVIKDKAYREEIVRKGFENVARFSFGQIADKYKELYDEIVAQEDI